MGKIKQLWILVATTLMLFSSPTQAEDLLRFDNLNKEDFDKVMSEATANFRHTSVSGASPVGGNILGIAGFGVEVGIIAGASSVPNINRLVQKADPNSEVKYFPNGSLLVRAKAPVGFDAELSFVPFFGKESFQFNQANGALQFQFSSPIPLAKFAVRGYGGLERVKAKTIINNESTSSIPVNSKLNLEIINVGAELRGSANLLFLEPFMGAGINHARGTLKVDGSGNIFNSSLTTDTSAKTEVNSFYLLFGTEVKLLFLRGGMEYAYTLTESKGTHHRAMFKLAFAL